MITSTILYIYIFLLTQISLFFFLSCYCRWVREGGILVEICCSELIQFTWYFCFVYEVTFYIPSHYINFLIPFTCCSHMLMSLIIMAYKWQIMKVSSTWPWHQINLGFRCFSYTCELSLHDVNIISLSKVAFLLFRLLFML